MSEVLTWVIKHRFGVKMDLCKMKKIIYVLITIITLTGCFTYVPVTHRFYPRQRNIKPYHRLGINGYRIPQQRFKKTLPQRRGR